MGSRSGRGEGRLHCKARCSKPKVCLSLSCLPESVRVKGQLVPCPSSAGIVFFISFPPTFYFEKCRARRGGGEGTFSRASSSRRSVCLCRRRHFSAFGPFAPFSDPFQSESHPGALPSGGPAHLGTRASPASSPRAHPRPGRPSRRRLSFPRQEPV